MTNASSRIIILVLGL